MDEKKVKLTLWLLLILMLLVIVAFFINDEKRFSESLNVVLAEPPSVSTKVLTPVKASTTPDIIEEPIVPTYNIVIYENEATALAQTAWGEARGCSTMEIAAVMWCVLNRVDSEGYGMGHDVEYVVSFPNQFLGYSPSFPVEDRLYNLAVDVLTRWQKEKQGASAEEVGRVLPQEYLYFHGDGEQNWFRSTYEHTGEYWDWSLDNPYVETE